MPKARHNADMRRKPLLQAAGGTKVNTCTLYLPGEESRRAGVPLSSQMHVVHSNCSECPRDGVTGGARER